VSSFRNILQKDLVMQCKANKSHVLKTASAFCLGFAKERIKKTFLFQISPGGNMFSGSDIDNFKYNIMAQ
jgi:hypothetical protein